jgi:anaerobic selenocysteine-containing dehydrogenase
LMKRVLERDADDLARGGAGKLDRAFIREHTSGFEALEADLEQTSWQDIEQKSGLTRGAIESAADVYVAAERLILCYGMGLTQHRNGTANVQQMTNFLMLRGISAGGAQGLRLCAAIPTFRGIARSGSPNGLPQRCSAAWSVRSVFAPRPNSATTP